MQKTTIFSKKLNRQKGLNIRVNHIYKQNKKILENQNRSYIVMTQEDIKI